MSIKIQKQRTLLELGFDISDINANDQRVVFMYCMDCLEEFLRPISHIDKPHNCLPHDRDCHDGALPRLECKLIHPDAKYPYRKRSSDAGHDITSIDDIIVPRFGMVNIHTGIIVAAPVGYYYTIEGRSSLWTKNITPYRGIIDATYTGELRVAMMNSSPSDYHVHKGDRIAQIILHKVIDFDLVPVNDFSDEYNCRGTDGFGSSGR